jgi:hypothetical protein
MARAVFLLLRQLAVGYPFPEFLHVVRGPGSIARHVAGLEPLQYLIRTGMHVCVRGQIKAKLEHGANVPVTKEAPDLARIPERNFWISHLAAIEIDLHELAPIIDRTLRRPVK